MSNTKVIERILKKSRKHMAQYLAYTLVFNTEELTPQKKRILTLHKNRFSQLDTLAISKINL